MDPSPFIERPRSLLIAGIGLCVGSLIAIDYAAFGWPNFGSGGLAASINEETARLVAKPRGTELISDKSRKVRDAIAHGDFTTARQIATDVLSISVLQNWRYYPFADFIGDVVDVVDPAFGTQLDKWVAQSASDPIPLLIRAKYYYAIGWFKRGDRFAARTQAADLASFADDMRKAQADLEVATGLNDPNPYGFYLKLLILKSIGGPDQMTDAFKSFFRQTSG